MRWARYAIPGFLAVVVVGWVWVDCPGLPDGIRRYLAQKRRQAAYRRDMRQLLSGQLIAVEFGPGVGAAPITTKNSAALKQVKSWLLSREANYINPPYGQSQSALCQPLCELVLVFEDGHREKMGFNLGSSATVWWNGYRLSGSDQPFTALARSQRP